MGHTPGPWHIDRLKSSVRIFAERATVCRVELHSYSDNSRKLADATLIAAAPELYDALKWALDQLQEFGVAYAPGDAALRKAEGKQP